jgi:hypothetical protein
LMFEEITVHSPPGLYIDNLTAIILRPLTGSDHGDETYA